jgi:hypothetical protein
MNIGMKKMSLAAVLGLALIGSVAMPQAAHADWHGRDWHHEDWNHHAAAARHWHGHPYGYGGPVVYAPPTVYAPPPQPSGISLILPLNFR